MDELELDALVALRELLKSAGDYRNIVIARIEDIRGYHPQGCGCSLEDKTCDAKAVSLIIAYGPAGGRTLELCGQHERPMLKKLRELAAQSFLQEEDVT